MILSGSGWKLVVECYEYGNESYIGVSVIA